MNKGYSQCVTSENLAMAMKIEKHERVHEAHHSSGYCSGTDMSTMLIRSNYGYLVDEMSPMDIIDRLVETSLISVHEQQLIKSKALIEDQNDVIVKSILRSAKTDSKVSTTFLGILEETYDWIGKRLQENVRQRTSQDYSKNAEMLEKNIHLQTKRLVEAIRARKLADTMYEMEALRTDEHDLIIGNPSESLRARSLIEIVLENRSFVQFAAALEQTKQWCILELLRKEDEMDDMETRFKGFGLMEVDEKQESKKDEGIKCSEVEAPEALRQVQDGTHECEDMEVVLSFQTDSHAATCHQIVQCFDIQTDHEMIDAEEYCVEHFEGVIESMCKGCVHIRLAPLFKSSSKHFKEEIRKGQLTEFIRRLLLIHPVRQTLPKGTFIITACIRLKTSVGSRLTELSEEERVFRSLAVHIADRFSPRMLLKKLDDQKRFSTHFLSELKNNSAEEGRRRATLSMLSQIRRCSSLNVESINSILMELLSEEETQMYGHRCPYCIKKHVIGHYRSFLTELDDRVMNFFCDIVSSLDEGNVKCPGGSFGCRRDYAQKLLQFALQSNIKILDLANVLDIYGKGVLICPQVCSHQTEDCSCVEEAAGSSSSKPEKMMIHKKYMCTNSARGKVNYSEPDEHTTQKEKRRVMEVEVDGENVPVELRCLHHGVQVKVDKDDSESSMRDNGCISFKEIPPGDGNEDMGTGILIKVYTDADDGYGSRSSSMKSEDSTDA